MILVDRYANHLIHDNDRSFCLLSNSQTPARQHLYADIPTPLTKIPQPHYFKISLRDIPSISRRLHLADMSPAHEQSLTSAPATLAIFHHILAPFRKCFLRSYPGFIYIQTNLFILTKRRPFDPPKGRRSSIFARRSEGRGRCWRGTLMSAHAYKR